MSVFDHPEFDQHESVHFVHDADTGPQGNHRDSLHGTRPRGRRLPSLAVCRQRRRR